MEQKLFWICVQPDILRPIEWCLQDFASMINPERSENLSALRSALAKKHPFALIIESSMAEESSLGLIEEIKKSHPDIRILMMVSAHTTRDEVIHAIKTKMVNGVLLRPFSAEQVADYITRFCRQA